MTTKNINGREVVFVEVPKHARKFSKAEFGELVYLGIGWQFLCNPPCDNYSIIGLVSSLSEEQWAGIVAGYDGTDDENIGSMIYECFDDSDFICNTATQSGLSLLSSLGMKPGTTLLLIKEK